MGSKMFNANFLVGLLKGNKERLKLKKEKAKAEKAESEAAKTESKEEYKDIIDYWKGVSASAGEDSEQKNYAEAQLNYYRGMKAGIDVIKPKKNLKVEGKITGLQLKGLVMDEKVGFVSDTSTRDFSLELSGEKKAKYVEAKRIHSEMTAWWNGLTDTQKAKQREAGTVIPTVDTIVTDLKRYSNMKSELKGELAAAKEEVAGEKEELTKAEADKKEYINNIVDNIDMHLGEIQALHKWNIANKLLQADSNSRGSADIEGILMEVTALNEAKAMKGMNPKIVRKKADDESLEKLVKFLTVYEEITGKKYQEMDSMWDERIFKKDAEAVDFNPETKEAIMTTFNGITPNSDSISLREYYNEAFTDEQEFIDEWDGEKEVQTKNPQYGKVRDDISQYLKEMHPGVYEYIDIVSKEEVDLAASTKKRDDITARLNTVYTSVLNISAAKNGYSPEVDNRKEIKDNRSEIVDERADIKDEREELPNPNWNQADAQAAADANEKYDVPEAIPNPTFGNYIPNPTVGQIIPNPMFNKNIENPGYGAGLVTYPYYEKEDEER